MSIKSALSDLDGLADDIRKMRARIAALEAENAELRTRIERDEPIVVAAKRLFACWEVESEIEDGLPGAIAAADASKEALQIFARVVRDRNREGA